ALPAWAADEKAAPATKAETKAPEKKVEKHTVAHIQLSGSMTEQAPSSDPLLGSAMPETFRQRLERIKKARDDSKVTALFLEIRGLAVSWGQVDELTSTIASVRKAGKKVYAYIEEGNPQDYLVGLACDDLCLPESSWLMLVGMRLE